MPKRIHRLLAVDPGKQHAGLAYFENGVLQALTLVTRKTTFEVAGAVALQAALYAPNGLDVCVVEGQQVYPHSGKDPNDLIPLAYCAGAVHALVRAKEQVSLLPRVWTKGRPKPVNQRRILQALRKDPATFALVEESPLSATKLSHALDAVGLGLYWYGAVPKEAECDS